jgi:excisionase family DNA binding protein
VLEAAADSSAAASSDATNATGPGIDGRGRADSAGVRDWLTPAQAAELLGVGSEAVRAALRRGPLAGERRATGWRIRRADVESYSERRRHGPTR